MEVLTLKSIRQALTRRLLRNLQKNADAGNVIVDGDGHRDYVGGLWETRSEEHTSELQSPC